MPEAIKMRALVQGEITDIRLLLQHPMETGMRKDEQGQLLAAHFIQTFVITHNGKVLIDAQLNTSIAKNPLFAFKARGIKPGDPLYVSWLDNIGEQRQDRFIAS